MIPTRKYFKFSTNLLNFSPHCILQEIQTGIGPEINLQTILR